MRRAVNLTYDVTVEGECEKRYFEWLEKQINAKVDPDFFKVKIKALISFSPEEAALLRNSSGKQILFQGKLLKYEALSRELYLSGGRILSIGE